MSWPAPSWQLHALCRWCPFAVPTPASWPPITVFSRLSPVQAAMNVAFMYPSAPVIMWACSHNAPPILPSLPAFAGRSSVPWIEKPQAGAAAATGSAPFSASCFTPLALQVAAVYHELVSEELVMQLQGQDKQLHAWTVDSPEALQRVLDAGVDGAWLWVWLGVWCVRARFKLERWEQGLVQWFAAPPQRACL